MKYSKTNWKIVITWSGTHLWEIGNFVSERPSAIVDYTYGQVGVYLIKLKTKNEISAV